MANSDRTHMEDNYFGWQIDRPVFVKRSVNAFGKIWKPGEEFNWYNQQFRAEDWFRQLKNVQSLYVQGFIHHDRNKEVANKVGDRLSEMNGDQLYSLVSQLNDIVRKNTSGPTEFGQKKCKISKINDKQRGLVRQWLRKNAWAQEQFYTIRDHILGE